MASSTTLAPKAPATEEKRPILTTERLGISMVRVNATDGTGYGWDAAAVAGMCNDAPVLNFTRLLAHSDLVSVVDTSTSTIPHLNFTVEALDFDTDFLSLQWTRAYHEPEGVYTGPGADDIT